MKSMNKRIVWFRSKNENNDKNDILHLQTFETWCFASSILAKWQRQQANQIRFRFLSVRAQQLNNEIFIWIACIFVVFSSLSSYLFHFSRYPHHHLQRRRLCISFFYFVLLLVSFVCNSFCRWHYSNICRIAKSIVIISTSYFRCFFLFTNLSDDTAILNIEQWLGEQAHISTNTTLAYILFVSHISFLFIQFDTSLVLEGKIEKQKIDECKIIMKSKQNQNWFEFERTNKCESIEAYQCIEYFELQMKFCGFYLFLPLVNVFGTEWNYFVYFPLFRISIHFHFEFE